jgi:RHS repeat-associated protein
VNLRGETSRLSRLARLATALPGFTPSDDANGNLTDDSSHTYSWAADELPVTLDAVGVTYDALGRMIEQTNGGGYKQIVYAPGGDKLAVMNGQALVKAYVSLPGGGTAVYASTGLSYYRHSDWLGTSRFASTPARATYYDGAYAPYGESYSEAGTTDRNFTGQDQETVTGIYDFLFRRYHPVQGRWISPDPAGLAAVDPANPQSLNRYAYVVNDPLNLIDPTGLRCVPVGKEGDQSCTVTSGGGGGYWWENLPGSGGGGICALLGLACGPDRPPIQPPDDPDGPGGGNPKNSTDAANNGFTLGVRAPGQTFNDCMKANAGNYSLLGAADFALDANGKIADNFWLGFTPASNTVTNVYNAATGSLTSLLQTGPLTVQAGMGTTVTYGRRTSSIMSLNLPGTPGGPKGGFPALGSAPSNAARAAKAAAGALKLAIDTGFFLAEAVGCSIPMNP